jgi:hypothetical protein
VAKAAGAVSRRGIAIVVLVGLSVGAVTLLAIEVANGTGEAGTLAVRDPCEPRPAYPGQGLDAALQRVVLDGLDGAACELGTTREELVLSLSPDSGVDPIPWDDETIERALRGGLLEAIDDAERRGSLNGILALAMRELVARAPVQWLIDGGQGIADLFG